MRIDTKLCYKKYALISILSIGTPVKVIKIFTFAQRKQKLIKESNFREAQLIRLIIIRSN